MNINFLALFFEGVLSFFSPCILPLIPMFVVYLTTSGEKDEFGNRSRFSRKKIMLQTSFFILGVLTTFMILAATVGLLKSFLEEYQMIISILAGVFLILVALHHLDFIEVKFFNSNKQLSLNSFKFPTSIQAFALGFVFSFAWSPCVGPILASVFSLALSAETTSLSYLYILVYAIGFLLPFMALGIFTERVLSLIKNHGNIVKYTIKIAAVILIGLGVNMIYTAVRDNQMLLDYYADNNNVSTNPYDFSLVDIDGNSYSLRDFKDKYLFVTFTATWCEYCNGQYPDLSDFNEDNDDLEIIVVMSPYTSNVTIDELKAFIKEKDYNLKFLIDVDGNLAERYGVAGFPYTYMFNKEGVAYKYLGGAGTYDVFDRALTELKSGGK